MLATENTEDFFSVSSVLSVADNINIDLYRLPLDLEWIQKYTKNAYGKANRSGINDLSLMQLGLALHVAQDRGAHGEGLPGKGHNKKFHKGKNW